MDVFPSSDVFHTPLFSSDEKKKQGNLKKARKRSIHPKVYTFFPSEHCENFCPLQGSLGPFGPKVGKKKVQK